MTPSFEASQLRSKLQELLRELDNFDGIDLHEHWDTDLSDLHVLDSMTISYLGALIEESFGLKIELSIFVAEIDSLKDLELYLMKEISSV